ncbi:MAG: 3-hydroxypropanoate dehydrogenase [Actinomycetota bacterium]|nr:3-hydroxypropanoate dehydrogenase [Actinomycetota bacterium]
MTAPPAEGVLALDRAAQDLLFRAARTANTFTAEPVTGEQIRAIHDLVKYGPTAFNAQPLRVVLLRSAGARQRLLPHLSPANRNKTAAAPLAVILAADTAFHEHLPRVFPHRPEARQWFDGPGNAETREAQARFNAALQIGYFIVGVRAAGLAAGPMAGFDPAGVDAEFFPDGRLLSLLVVNLGQPGPEAWHDRLPRLTTADVLHTL